MQNIISFALSLLSMLLTFLNVFWYQDNTPRIIAAIFGVLLLVLAVYAFTIYHGSELEDSYTVWGVKVFSAIRAVNFVAIIASGLVLFSIVIGWY